VKHESNIGLLNQLFDGQGDKSSFAKMRERFVPPNSTSMTLGVQPQPFFCALVAIGKTVWQDSGFAEISLHYSETLQVLDYYINIHQKYTLKIFLMFLNIYIEYLYRIFKRNI